MKRPVMRTTPQVAVLALGLNRHTDIRARYIDKEVPAVAQLAPGIRVAGLRRDNDRKAGALGRTYVLGGGGVIERRGGGETDRATVT